MFRKFSTAMTSTPIEKPAFSRISGAGVQIILPWWRRRLNRPDIINIIIPYQGTRPFARAQGDSLILERVGDYLGV